MDDSASRKRRDEGELLRLLAENVTDYAIFVVDEERVVRTWTAGAERLLGYREEEILGRSSDVIFTPEDRERGVPAMELELARGTGRANDDRWHLRKDGSRFWSGGMMTPLLDEDGRLRGFAKIMRDRTEWKRNEEARVQSEARFRGLMEQAPFSIQRFSPDGKTIQVNQAWEDLWGLTAEQVADYNVLEDPQLAAKGIRPYIERAFRGTPTDVPAIEYDVEESLPDRSEHFDARRLISAVAYPIKDDQGRVAEVILIHDDQTARLRAEENYQQSEERFRRIVDQSVAGFAEVDLAGRFLFANERYCAIVGRTLSELTKLTMQEISHPDDLPKNLELFQRSLEEGLPFDIEKRYLRPDGTVVWVSNSVSVLRDDAGAVRSSIAICVDITARKQAEQAWREEEHRVRTLIDNLPHGAVYRSVRRPGDEKLSFAYLSAGVERIFGVTAEEGVADAGLLYGAIHEGDIERVIAEERAALDSLQQFDSEFRVRHRSGELRWIHCRSAPHRLSEGEYSWEGVILDVTDRRHTEQSLRDERERLRIALDAGRMGTWSWDIPTGRVHWSTQLEAIHGLAPGTFEGTFGAYQSDMHPEDRERVLASIRRTLETGAEHHLEYRVVWPDGSVHWVESRGKLLRDAQGQPASMMGVCTEVTARKRVEFDQRFLSEASHTLATATDPERVLERLAGLAVPHFADWCTIELLGEGGVLRTAAIAHIDPSKVELALTVRRRWPADPNSPTGIYQVLRSGEPSLFPEITEEMLRASTDDDEYYAVLHELGLRSYMCVPLGVHGRYIGVMTFIAAESGRRYGPADLATAADLARRAAFATENAQLYATLREEARRKDEFLAMLAHELRNPLAPIRSGLDLLELMGTDPEILESMQRQVEHLVRLVDDLLDVSRIMRGKVELRKVSVDIASVVTRAVETVRPLVEAAKQTLAVDVPAESVWLQGDPVRLAQVFGNLLNNASKYTEPGGEIRLSAEVESEGLVVRVRDTGIGIRPELLPRVFELFIQDQRTIDRSQGGLGIGLTVVKSLVEMHGGSVTAHSAGLGKGSEFTVRLPLHAGPLAAPSGPAAPESMGRLNILIVDDNVAAARMLAKLLQVLGPHALSLAHDGLAALEVAREKRPDLILLDIGLPRMDGYEVARQLRREPAFERTRIIALTGYGTEEDRRKSLEAGCDDHLVKPPGIDAIRKIVAETTG